MVSRQQIEQELRKQMPGTYDYQPLDVQESLIATRMRDLGSREPVANPNAPVVIKHRTPHVPLVQPFPGADVSEGELRQALAMVIEDALGASHDAKMAKVWVERAHERLQDCQQELASFDDLDEKLADNEITAMRHGESGDELPYALESELRERSIARDRLERARSAVQRTIADSQRAEQNHATAQQRLQHAISSLAIHEARCLMVELDELEEQAYGLRTKIASLQIVGTMPADVSGRPFKQLVQVRRDPQLTRSWAEFMQRLRKDPHATLDGDAE